MINEFTLFFAGTCSISGLDRSGTLWNRSLQLLAYADDIDIIERSEKKAVKEAFQALEISATNMGLTINEDKTKFLETMPSSVNNTSFCVNGHSFERVREFKYLGTIINDQNKLKAEINNRIKSANKCFFGLKKQLRSKFISGKTKLRLYKTLILPVLLYASESWTLNLETIRAL
ncbi:reverse transcriptase domain-containing protein [Trichonephila clavipes]|nr:reverse transcriptase domain-containing protein [Trichonephila clavipes]